MSSTRLTMFLDESGDHGLVKIDPKYPVFVLGGIIVNDADLDKVIIPAVCAFKKDLFEDEQVILHTADIARNRGVFAKMKDGHFRKDFLAKLNCLMSALPYMVVACVIQKDKLVKQYTERAWNPYNYALKILVERFVYELSERAHLDTGIIIAESRDDAENKRLFQEWESLKKSGTKYISKYQLNLKIRDLKLKNKAENVVGLQLADLIVSPIGRKILGKETKEDYTIIEQKFRRIKGSIKGCGLIVLP